MMTSRVRFRIGRGAVYILSLVLLTFVISFNSRMSLAAEAGPEQVILQISERLSQIFAQDQDRLRSDPAYQYQLANDVLVPHIDFSKVSSLVLGKHWQRATPDQQAAFRRQFQRLLVRTYSTAFTELKEWEIRILPTRISENGLNTVVRTHLMLPQMAPIEVLYQMHLKDGSWMAYDVKIDGISLVTNYRSSFGREVRSLGMDGLIRKITALNEKRVQNQDIKNS